MSKLKKIAEFLKANPIQILSTSIDNQPISRPLGSATLIGDKIYYCMNKDKKMFEELNKNPKVCVCVCAPNYSWLRLFAKVCFDESLKIKQEFINLKKTRFENPADERFKVFYLHDIIAEIHKGLEVKIIKI